MEQEELTLATICKGAIPEVFKRELDAVMRNIKDVNTPAKQKRTISIEISFDPFKDRSGWLDSFSVKAKLAGIQTDNVQGSAFIAAQDGVWKAFPHDDRQTALFSAQETSGPKQ